MPIDHEHKETQNTWEKFCESRINYVHALADTVEAGVKRHDTTHPAFCGCIDWHSSVHGAYALLAASRFTGESRWVDVVEPLLSPERLAGELACLQSGELDHEMPYGYAWFLKLACERERWGGKTDLLPLATDMAQKLERWIFSLSDDEVTHHALRRDYGNLSWAVLNLWEWSRWKDNKELNEKLLTFTKKRLLTLDKELPISYDDNIDEFFAASLQRTRAILTILDAEELQVWITSYYPEGVCFNPLEQSHRPHSAGLNFSRSWGLWALFKVTEDEVYRNMYVNHIVTHIQAPQYWRDDYKKYSHWVPQFGIYAIALSMDVEGTG